MLIVLAVVLALLVLLCAGVISFLYKQGKANNGSGPLGGTHPHAAVVNTGVSGGAPPAASYRLSKQTGAKPGWIRANEGRQTL